MYFNEEITIYLPSRRNPSAMLLPPTHRRPARHAPGHEEDAHVSVYVLLLLVFPSVDPSSSSLLLLSRTTDAWCHVLHSYMNTF